MQLGLTPATTDVQTIVGPVDAIANVRNPIAASGGAEPESMAEARIRAPEVFARQRRAVTPQDYANRLQDHPLVQRAVVQRRWTGSWSTLFCTVDLVGGAPLDRAAEVTLRKWVEPWRTMGHDIEIDEPLLVAVELELCIGLENTARRSSVRRALHARLGTGVLPDGSLGLFHPDRLTFGQRIYLSAIYAECQSVPGVIEVDIMAFGRQGSADTVALDRGFVELRGREIAILANDPDRPELGALTIHIEGGR
jgi:predicted phage baseplate assembly protein